MKDLIVLSMIGLLLLFVLAGGVWSKGETNHYNEITEMLQVPQVPYPSPSNMEEVNANLAYISQNIRAILRENQAVINRVKAYIEKEKAYIKKERD